MGLSRLLAKQLGLSAADLKAGAVRSLTDIDADTASNQSTDTRSISRRKMLFGAMLASMLEGGEAQAAPSTSATRWLINRITFGWTRAEQLLADQLGYHGYLEYQLNHTAIDDSALQQRLSAYWHLIRSPIQLYNMNQPSFIVHQLVESTFLRAVHSKRQLYQKMVEFWADHFHIDITSSLNPWIRLVDIRNVVMPNALGKFPDLLNASARSPSMLMYLNNDRNTASAINENYARELMELHTLGVDGGYTQQDVSEVARCFTGWRYVGTDGQGGPANALTFEFYQPWHDWGAKTVLGQLIPAGGGMNDAEAVLDILANHPSTARFVAKKLCKRFYSYDPPISLIDSVAQTYTSTGGDIKAMLRTLFNSIDPVIAPPKLKRPFNLFTSAFRATGADVVDFPEGWTTQLRDLMSDCGHQPYHWGPPDGYPDSLEFWVNLLLPRWNFASMLGSMFLNQVNFNITAFMSGVGSPDGMADRISSAMFPSGMTTLERNLIRDYLAVDPFPTARQREAVGLAVASPSFQWH